VQKKKKTVSVYLPPEALINFYYICIIYKYNHMRPAGRGLETRDLYFYLWGQLRPRNIFSSKWKRRYTSPTQFYVSQTIHNRPWTFKVCDNP